MATTYGAEGRIAQRQHHRCTIAGKDSCTGCRNDQAVSCVRPPADGNPIRRALCLPQITPLGARNFEGCQEVDGWRVAREGREEVRQCPIELKNLPVFVSNEDREGNRVKDRQREISRWGSDAFTGKNRVTQFRNWQRGILSSSSHRGKCNEPIPQFPVEVRLIRRPRSELRLPRRQAVPGAKTGKSREIAAAGTGFPGGIRDDASLSMQRYPRAVGCGDPVSIFPPAAADSDSRDRVVSATAGFHAWQNSCK